MPKCANCEKDPKKQVDMNRIGRETGYKTGFTRFSRIPSVGVYKCPKCGAIITVLE